MDIRSLHVVLIHGGWADAGIWAEVIRRLLTLSVSVTAAQLPLTSFQDDLEALSEHLAFHEHEAYLLVGHSYGGAVITQAAIDPRVKGLVYLAASAPSAGITLGQFMQQHPPPAPLALIPGVNGTLWGLESFFTDALAHDLEREQARVLFCAQRPVHAAIMAGVVTHEGWRHIPTWYAVATHDRIADPVAQESLAAEMNASLRLFEAGHMLPVNSADAIAQLVLEALESINSEPKPSEM